MPRIGIPDIRGQFKFDTGTASAPSMGFRLDTDTGIYTNTADTLSFSTSGTRRFSILPDGSLEFVDISAPGVTTNKLYVVSGTLYWDGSDISSGGLSNVVEDTTPELGGDLDVGGFDIEASSGGAYLRMNDTTSFLQGKYVTGGIGTNITINAGGSNLVGGGLNLWGGDADAVGGTINITGGDGGTGAAGDLQLNGGLSTDGIGGEIKIKSGNSTNGTSGDIQFIIGSGSTVGSLKIQAVNSTGAVVPLKFLESGANTDYVALQAPSSVSISRTWTLPQDDPSTADGQFLTTDSSGVMSFAAGGISDVVEDTSPQLGGDLDVNDFDIVGKPAAGATSPGNNVVISASDGGATSGAGGAVNIYSGSGGASEAGGDILIKSSPQGASSSYKDAGSIRIEGAAHGVTSGYSYGYAGNVEIYGGATAGASYQYGGHVFIVGGATAAGAYNLGGGDIRLWGGSCSATGSGSKGGFTSIRSGGGNASAPAGNIEIKAGGTGGSGYNSSNDGNITVSAATGESGSSGGKITFLGGNSLTGTGGNIILQPGYRVTGKDSNGNVVISYGTSGIVPELQLREDLTNGTNYIGLKAPASVTTSRAWTLPQDDPSSVAGQLLTTDSSGVLSFSPTIRSATVATTDDTTTTIISIPVASGAAARVRAEWVAVDSTNSEGGHGEVEAAAYNNAGTLGSIAGESVTNNGLSTSSGTVSVNYNDTSDEIEIQVTGGAATTNISWSITATIVTT